MLNQPQCPVRQPLRCGSGRNGCFEVTLRNRTRYLFRQDRGRLWIRDDSGRSWPADRDDRGRGVVYRWADMVLEARAGNTRDNGRNND